MARAKIKKTVFVCTGNTCRSPMAEAAFSEEAKRRNLPAAVTSAGIKVSESERDLNVKAAIVLRENGLELPYFSSTSLTKQTLLGADIIVCMTRQQRDFLKTARKKLCEEAGKPRARNNVFCIADFTGEDVPDPYGKGEEAYRAAFESIVGAFPAIIEKWFTKKPRANSGKKKKKKE